MARSSIIAGLDSALSVESALVPSAATVTLYDRTGTAIVTDASATTGTETTVDAASGLGESDASVIHATSVTGMSPGDRLAIVDEYGRTEYVTVEGIDSAGRILLPDDLQRAYAIGDAVHCPLGASYTVPADTWDDYETSCRARWTLTVGGATVTEDTLFDVVASPITQPITVATLASVDPMADAQLPSAMPDWGPILASSFDRLLGELESAGLYPRMIIDDGQLRLLHRLAFRLHLAEMGIEPATTYIQGGAISHFAGELAAQIKRIRVAWIDGDSDLVVDSDEEDQQRRVRTI